MDLSAAGRRSAGVWPQGPRRRGPVVGNCRRDPSWGDSSWGPAVGACPPNADVRCPPAEDTSRRPRPADSRRFRTQQKGPSSWRMTGLWRAEGAIEANRFARSGEAGDRRRARSGVPGERRKRLRGAGSNRDPFIQDRLILDYVAEQIHVRDGSSRRQAVTAALGAVAEHAGASGAPRHDASVGHQGERRVAASAADCHDLR